MKNGVIQISCLGNYGRVGNQLFQYAFARGYAESIGAQLETPPWIGQVLFKDINDPPLSQPLPTLENDEHPDGNTNVNLLGYFQYARCFDAYTITKLKQWFAFRDVIVGQQTPVNLAVHLRRGDYVTQYADTYCTVSLDAYRKAIIEEGYNPEDVKVVSDINPSNGPLPGAEWLPDFLTLFSAKVLFRANSTFSWWAACLGQHDAVFSPVVEGLRGYQDNVGFVKGNHPRCVSLPNVHPYLIKA